MKTNQHLISMQYLQFEKQRFEEKRNKDKTIVNSLVVGIAEAKFGNKYDDKIKKGEERKINPEELHEQINGLVQQRTKVELYDTIIEAIDNLILERETILEAEENPLTDDFAEIAADRFSQHACLYAERLNVDTEIVACTKYKLQKKQL